MIAMNMNIIKSIYKQKLFLIGILIISTFVLVGSYYITDTVGYTTIKSVMYKNLNYNNHSDDINLSAVKEFSETIESDYKEINISFYAKVKSISGWNNIFQTAPLNSGIRMELSEPSALGLVIKNKNKDALKGYIINQTLQLGRWYFVNVKIDINNHLNILLDDETVIDLIDPNIDYDISEIAVGSGFSKTRPFDGELSKFEIKYTFFKKNHMILSLLSVLKIISILLLIICTFLVYYKIDESLEPDATEIPFIPGIAVILMIVGHFAGPALPVPSHWLHFLLLGLITPLFAPLYVKLFNSKLSTDPYVVSTKILAGLALLVSIIFMIYQSIGKLNQFSPRLLILIIGTTILFTTAKSGYLEICLKTANMKRWFFNIIIILFSIALWCALFELPNWTQFANSLTERPLATLIIYYFFLDVVLRQVFNIAPSPLPHVFSAIYSKTGRMLPLLFIATAFVIFLLMSFRFDTLSVEGHWEYFVGPIRNIKNGSWLLWDTPSQYGFLNILAAGLLPIQSAWQSLYLLQGLLLFFAAIMIFTAFVSDRISRFFFAFVITFSSLFFADPDLIGPYLFPSSSVMRFFWCYALLFFFFIAYRKDKISMNKIVFSGTLLWLPGFFWSSESAIYSSVIFFCALVAAISQHVYERRGDDRNTWLLIKKISAYLSIPILSLLLLIGIVSIYYWINLGHFPDLFIFVEHGFAYTGGFGSVQLNPFGSVWILFLLFCTILTIIVRLINKRPLNRHVVPLVASAGCLWAVSSYFIGRAVPNNITAILPILCILIAIVLKTIERLESDLSHVIFKVVTVPIFMLILMTSFGNINFVEKLRNFRTLTSNVSQQVRMADPLLQALITEAKIKRTDPVVYYGDAASCFMPRWKSNDVYVVSEKTWLPNPLQLLEEPIKDDRRNIYLHRFMDRSTQGGYFIQAKGLSEDRVAKWFVLIAKTHSPSRVYENSKWKIIYYERLKSS